MEGTSPIKEQSTQPALVEQLVAVAPHLVRFSQSAVRKFNCWQGNKVSPTLVVQFPDSSLTSHDNWQLLSAQRAGKSDPHFEMQIALRRSDEEWPEQEDDACPVYQLTCRDPNNAGLWEYVVRPRTFGSAIALRSARQGREFPLEGTAQSPVDLSQCPDFVPPRADAKIRGRSDVADINRASMDLGAAAAQLETFCASDDADIFCSHHTKHSALHSHPDLKRLLAGRVSALLVILSCKLHSNWRLKAAADFDDRDDAEDHECWEFDLEIEADQDEALQDAIAEEIRHRHERSAAHPIETCD